MAIFTFLVKEFFKDGLGSGLALAALYIIAASAVLYFATLFAYDSLQMPSRFWGEKVRSRKPPRWLVMRPPSAYTWVLYQNMVRTWNWVSVPATTLLGLGLVLLGADALSRSDPSTAASATGQAAYGWDLWLWPTVWLLATAIALA